MKLRPLYDVISTAVLTLSAAAIAVAVIKRDVLDRRPPMGVHPPVFRPGWTQYATSTKVIGPPDAPITVVEFADFLCPYCRDFSESLDSLMRLHPDQVRVFYRHFPLSAHPYSHAAALAAECAAYQGRFDAFYHAMFRNPQQAGVVPWTDIAREARIDDPASYSTCLSGPTALKALRDDSLAGLALGIAGTPLVIVNGWEFPGTPTTGEMDNLIQKHPFGSR